jgi:hypothetical protein
MVSKFIPAAIVGLILAFSASTSLAGGKGNHAAKHKAHREAVFQKLDTNNDGSLSKEEFAAKKAKKHGKHHKKNHAAAKGQKGKKGKHVKKGKKAKKTADS